MRKIGVDELHVLLMSKGFLCKHKIFLIGVQSDQPASGTDALKEGMRMPAQPQRDIENTLPFPGIKNRKNGREQNRHVREALRHNWILCTRSGNTTHCACPAPLSFYCIQK